MDTELLSVTLPVYLPADEVFPSDRPYPEWWGRAVQAAFLSSVRSVFPTLSDQLHQENNLHPYTVSGLLGISKHGIPQPEKTYYLRFTSVSSALSEAIHTMLLPGAAFSADVPLALDFLPFRIHPTEKILVETSTFSKLIAKGVERACHSAFELSLRSPVVFKSDGKTNPLPLPALVYRSLLNKWNSFSPIAFPEDTIRFATECLAVSAFNIKSIPIPIKQSGLRIGAVGRVRYRALNRDRYWLSILQSLTAFAFFIGIGAGTGFGLGQTRNPDPKN